MRSQAGFSLLEVLVAVTILVVGLLGLAGLQLATLRWTADASQSGAVARLGQEIAEKIRSQPGQIDRYLAAAGGTPSADSRCYATAGCPPDAMVATDIAEWRDQVAAALPAGFATICRDRSPADGSVGAVACTGGADDPVVIKFWWTARDARGHSVAADALSTPVAVLPLRP
ncbi:MAG: type IV pilus modification protein PilV [Burkholderiaceae bacterium]